MKKYHKPLLQNPDQAVIEHALGLGPELRIALEKLLIEGKLEGAAKGITEQVLTRGKPSLSPKQEDVFTRYVMTKHKLL